jgi:hypothetical protein
MYVLTSCVHCRVAHLAVYSLAKCTVAYFAPYDRVSKLDSLTLFAHPRADGAPSFFVFIRSTQLGHLRAVLCILAGIGWFLLELFCFFSTIFVLLGFPLLLPKGHVFAEVLDTQGHGGRDSAPMVFTLLVGVRASAHVTPAAVFSLVVDAPVPRPHLDKRSSLFWQGMGCIDRARGAVGISCGGSARLALIVGVWPFAFVCSDPAIVSLLGAEEATSVSSFGCHCPIGCNPSLKKNGGL